MDLFYYFTCLKLVMYFNYFVFFLWVCTSVEFLQGTIHRSLAWRRNLWVQLSSMWKHKREMLHVVPKVHWWQVPFWCWRISLGYPIFPAKHFQKIWHVVAIILPEREKKSFIIFLSLRNDTVVIPEVYMPYFHIPKSEHCTTKWWKKLEAILQQESYLLAACLGWSRNRMTWWGDQM